MYTAYRSKACILWDFSFSARFIGHGVLSGLCLLAHTFHLETRRVRYTQSMLRCRSPRPDYRSFSSPVDNSHASNRRTCARSLVSSATTDSSISPGLPLESKGSIIINNSISSFFDISLYYLFWYLVLCRIFPKNNRRDLLFRFWIIIGIEGPSRSSKPIVIFVERKHSSDLYLNFYWNRISVGSLILFNKRRFYFSCSDWEEGRIDCGTFQQGWHRRFEIAEEACRTILLRAEISTRYSRILAIVKDLFSVNNSFLEAERWIFTVKWTVCMCSWFLYQLSWLQCFIMSSGFRSRWVILVQVS